MRISGLKKKIEGSLIGQFFDDTGSLGFAYERSIQYLTKEHHHDWHMLVFPRQSSSLEFILPEKKCKIEVDSTEVLWMPKNTIHKQQASSLVWDCFAIYLSDEYWEKVGQKLGKSQSATLSQNSMKAQRSDLVQLLMEDLFQEKVIAHSQTNDLMSLIDVLVNKSFLLLLNNASDKTNGTRSNAAIEYIERNLFDKIDMKLLAKHCGVSSATLFRKFKADFKMTPYDYIKVRKLEEAKKLLKKGKHTINEICYLVGYSDPSSFSRSFKSHFGVPPGEIGDK